MKKTALITGICGQDAAYLAKFLLDKDYKVYGLYRRTTRPDFSNLEFLGISKDIEYIQGDMTDQASLNHIVHLTKPDEIYNLAAQSFVGGSWDYPESTSEINAMGTLYLLEAMKHHAPKAHFYQASTSEMVGTGKEGEKQNEKTPLHPRSPYAISKLFAHWMVDCYRESYGLFCCSGILWNHESIPKNSPIIIKESNNLIDILPIEDVFSNGKHRNSGLLEGYKNISIWNGEDWTKVIKGTAYQDKNKSMKLIQTRESCYEATLDHIAFDQNNKEIKTEDFKKGQMVFKCKYPNLINKLDSDLNFAKFLGFVVGDGNINEKGNIRLTGINKKQLIDISKLVLNKYGWKFNIHNSGPGKYEGCSKNIFVLKVNADPDFGRWIKGQIYTSRSNEKRIPKFILNSSKTIRNAFFDGYYLADGRNKGNQNYQYKGFTTSSATLCMGLIYISRDFTGKAKVKCEYRNAKKYYYTYFNHDNPSKIINRKISNEIIKTFYTTSEDGWFYDIQTKSKTFSTGPNMFKIHNSPLRGREFVTRKITDAVAKIHLGKQKEIFLGNIDAQRDWGFSGDYVEAMWLMLQQKEPDDYCIASGETHSIRDFLDAAFNKVGIKNWKPYVKIDAQFNRPNDVVYLCGDSTKAREKLGWTPKTSFKQLVEMMVSADIKRNLTVFK